MLPSCSTPASSHTSNTQALAQVLDRSESLGVQLRAKKEEVEQLQRELSHLLRQSQGEEVPSVGNREAQEAAALGNQSHGSAAGDDGEEEWNGNVWNGSDAAGARDSSFANPQPQPASPAVAAPLQSQTSAAGGPLSTAPSEHVSASVLEGLQGHESSGRAGRGDSSQMTHWNGALQGHADLRPQLEAIHQLAARCAAEGASHADLASLLRHAQSLRPSLFSQWPSPAGETVEVGSWEELCTWLFAAAPPHHASASASPMVYCGKPSRHHALLTTAQEAGEACQVPACCALRLESCLLTPCSQHLATLTMPGYCLLVLVLTRPSQLLPADAGADSCLQHLRLPPVLSWSSWHQCAASSARASMHPYPHQHQHQYPSSATPGRAATPGVLWRIVHFPQGSIAFAKALPGASSVPACLVLATSSPRTPSQHPNAMSKRHPPSHLPTPVCSTPSLLSRRRSSVQLARCCLTRRRRWSGWLSDNATASPRV